MFQVCDRAVILRRGEVVADLTVADTTIEEVERLITGTTAPV